MNIGVTGHQKLDDPGGWLWVAEAMRSELSKLSMPFVCITSLAIGADQLFATLVLELGGAVHAVLPYKDIEQSFSSDDVGAYRALVQRADIEVLSVSGTNEDAYLAAGQRVVDLSEVVFAVWNGLPAKDKGGTADVVAYALNQGTSVVVIDPIQRLVSHSPQSPDQ